MKKLLLLFFSLLAYGYMFQACDNSKTYDEMLDEEKDAVNAFIKKHNIQRLTRKKITIEVFSFLYLKYIPYKCILN